MIQSHRPIPRETDVPLHIAVEAEKIAEIILTEIGRIASAVRDAFPMFAIRTDAKNRRFALDQRRRMLNVDVRAIGETGTVAGHEINETIVPAQQRMRIVIAARSQLGADTPDMAQVVR